MVVDPKPIVQKFQKEAEEILNNLEHLIDASLKKEMKKRFFSGPSKQIPVILTSNDYKAYQKLTNFDHGLWGNLLEKYQEAGWSIECHPTQRTLNLSFSYQQD